MPDLIALAWAAGIYEGEGTCCSGPNSVCVRINMCDEDIVRRFRDVVGLGKVSGPHDRNPGVWTPVWTWQTGTFEDFQAVLAMLWGWLGIRRRAQARAHLQRVLTRYRGSKLYAPNQAAFAEFGKRYRDLTLDERRLYGRRRAQEHRDRQLNGTRDA